jgi:GGDEF domain-containing protein
LERQDWHLWVLAMLLMFVLGLSLLSFMFPTIFWFGEELPVRAPQRAFFGFAVLLALALVYMVQRQATVRRLRRRLYQAQLAVTAAERMADEQTFLFLPAIGQFRDSLAMEYLRASRSSSPLAVLLADVAGGTREGLGRISVLFRNMQRQGEAVFRVGDNSLAMILPGMPALAASAFATLVRDRIGEVAPGLEVRVSASAYPEQVASLAQLESAVRDAAA